MNKKCERKNILFLSFKDRLNLLPDVEKIGVRGIRLEDQRELICTRCLSKLY